MSGVFRGRPLWVRLHRYAGLATALLVEAGGGSLCYEIIGADSGRVIGVTQDPLSVLSGEPGATFNRIRLARFNAYRDNPWTDPSPGCPGRH